MGFLKDCKAEFAEGLREHPLHSMESMLTTDQEYGPNAAYKPVRPHTENPSITKQVVKGAIDGVGVRHAMEKTGFSPIKAMEQARMMKLFFNNDGQGKPGPASYDDNDGYDFDR